MKKIFIALCCYLAPMALMAQNTNSNTDNLDFLRSIGKIYVAVGVLLIIFIGIVIFLVRLDSNLTNLENQIKNE
jgi:hypothetical protein